MSARRAPELGTLRMEPLPIVVLAKIRLFLEAGTTGQIVLDVKEGRVLGYKLTEAGRVHTEHVDNVNGSRHD